MAAAASRSTPNNSNSNVTSLSPKAHEIGQPHPYAILCIIIIFLGLFVAVRCLTRTSAPPPLHQTTSTEPDPGLNEEEFQQLPEHIYRPSAKEVQICTICLEDIQQGRRCRRLPSCGHLYHTSCIDESLVKISKCPNCRGTALPAAATREHEDQDEGVGARREEEEEQIEEIGHVFDHAHNSEEEASMVMVTTEMGAVARKCSLKRRPSSIVRVKGEVEPSSS